VAPTLYDLGDTIESWAAGVVDQCAGDGPLVVVGSSVGGSCAVEVAVLAPERVRSLVLIGAKAAHRPEPDFRDEAIRLMHDDGLDAAWARYWEPLFAPHADPEVVERARRIMQAQGVDAVARGTRVFHTRPDRAAFLDVFAGEVTIVRGEHDRIGKDPNVVIPGAGHYVPIEHPAALTAVITNLVE
jgi:pimeloyl-ACP methyl ester carboxylesterase